MDQGLLSLRTCVKLLFTIVYLLGSAYCSDTASSSADSSCLCRDIPPRNDTQNTTKGCYKLNDIFRYKCNDGLVRKVGTSNMIKCEGELKWSNTTLICIQNPLDPPQTTTKKPSPVTPSTEFKSLARTETTPDIPTFTPQHATEPPLETTTLPQSSTKPPLETTTLPQSSTNSTSTSSPVTLQRFHSTHSPPPTSTTPNGSSVPHQTTLSSFFISNSTSSPHQGTVVTNVVSAIAVIGVLLGAAVGLFLLNRRRSRNIATRKQTPESEESIPMNHENDISSPT